MIVTGNFALYGVIALMVIGFFALAIRIMREYERGVIFTLGRFTGVKGPGFMLLIPFVQQMVRVDLRTVVEDVPTQDVISRDNVSVKVNAVIYFRVVDPEKAINRVENFAAATSQLAQTTLRSVLGKHELDEMLAERDKLNRDVQGILDQQTDDWGIKVANVEIKHVDLDESMIRAIAKQAEAERVRRARASSMPKASSRRRKNSCRRPKSSRAKQAPCSCVTSRRCRTSPMIAVPLSCFRFQAIWPRHC